MNNKDFLMKINEVERTVLQMMEYKVNVSKEKYIKMKKIIGGK
jgi:hypothetical protein